MDKLQKSDLEQILGIYSPYSIRSLDLNPVDETLLITLAESAKKSRFSIRAGSNTNKRDSQQSNRQACHWHHVRLGRFNTQIRAYINPESTSVSRFSFLGDSNKKYSFGLQQAIEQAKGKGLDADTIATVLGLDLALVKSILMDIEISENEKQAESILPLETDPIWRAVLTHELNLTTKLLPLKLLLSRLKLNVYSQKNSDVMQSAVAELRQFFAQHAPQLKSEFAQLGINTASKPTEQTAKPKLKLKLPGLNNPIWHQILSGSFDLHSRDMPLNLFITKLKKQYADNADSGARRQVISDLQSFFKKNARALILELKILTKIIQGEVEVDKPVALPKEDHVIWQRLLENEASLPTEKMAYLLLLSRLRSTFVRSTDATEKDKAIRQLREFFVQNQSMFAPEIEKINDLSIAI